VDEVRYRCVGQSGLRVSVLGLGCGGLGTRLDRAGSERVVRQALDLGVNLFDTAGTYGDGASEEALGAALAGARDQAVIATKFRWKTGSGPNDRGASRIHIRSAVEASLRRLGTDRIDLYQWHAPDPNTPVEETLAALEDLVTAGKVLYTGSSNLAGWQLVDAHWRAAGTPRGRFVSTQAPLSLIERGAERELLPAARACGVGFIAALALARGFLAGSFGPGDDPAALPARRRAYLTEANLRARAALNELAALRSLRPAQLALAGVADLPGVTAVLAGASTPEQLAEAAQAVASGCPPDLLADLAAVSRGDA
jgi:aryl-alcohol dehydrogenase-like predicted oxidoreductase